MPDPARPHAKAQAWLMMQASGGGRGGGRGRAGRTRGAAKKGGGKKPARDAFFPAGHAHRLGPPLRARGRRPAPPHLFPAFKGQAASVHHSPAWRRPGWRPWWFVEGGGGEKRVGGGERRFTVCRGSGAGERRLSLALTLFFFASLPSLLDAPFLLHAPQRHGRRRLLHHQVHLVPRRRMVRRPPPLAAQHRPRLCRARGRRVLHRAGVGQAGGPPRRARAAHPQPEVGGRTGPSQRRHWRGAVRRGLEGKKRGREPAQIERRGGGGRGGGRTCSRPPPFFFFFR